LALLSKKKRYSWTKPQRQAAKESDNGKKTIRDDKVKKLWLKNTDLQNAKYYSGRN